MRSRTWIRSLLPFLLTLTVTLTLTSGLARLDAQQGAGDATLSGAVTDPTAALVAGAEVTLSHADTGYTRTLRTAEDGRYRAVALPVGSYHIQVAVQGFQTARHDVTLTVGSAVTLNIRLELGGETTSVEVTARAAVTNPGETANVGPIGAKAVADLPIRGRNFVEFAQLSPGASQESDRGGLVVAGQRSINSNVAVDGMDFNDSLQGNQRGGNDGVFFFPQLAIREFQVVRSGAGAEVGRTNAAFVNAVTRTGTNAIHGDALHLNRNPALTGKDAFGRDQENEQHQIGGALGGPLVASSPVLLRRRRTELPARPLLRPVRSAPGQRSGAARGPRRARRRRHLDQRHDGGLRPRRLELSSRQRLDVNYLYSRLRGENFGVTSSQTNIASSNNYANTRKSHGVKAALQSILTPAMLNEARFQWAVDDRTEEAYVNAPEIRITGFGRVGGAQSRPQFLNTERWQFVDNLTGSWRRHQWKTGLDVNISPQFQNRAQLYRGQYQFRSYADYLSGRIQRFQQAIPVSSSSGVYEGTQKELALYATDTWTPAPTVTATLGLRWEGQWNPQPPNLNPRFVETNRVPNDLSMWQPRAGLSWNPDGKGRSVFRVSTGVLAARTPATIFARVFHDNGINVVGVDSNVDARVLQTAPFPDAFDGVPPGISGIVPRVFGIDEDFRNPRSFQAAVTFERTLGEDWSAWISGLYNRTWNLHRMLDRNLAPPTYNAAGMPIFPSGRPDPTIGILQINESTAHSRYRGLLTGLRRRMSDRVTVEASYTFAVNRDDDSNERDFSRNLVLDPYNLENQWGYSKQDIRHNTVISGVVRLPLGFTYSSILQARSGLPYTAVIGSDTQNDGNTANDRAIVDGRVVARNSFRQPSFFNWDMRLLKELPLGHARLTLSVEAFNVTAASNKNFGPDQESIFGTPASPNANFGIPFEAPSSARFGGARQVQLGARVAF